MDQIYALMAVFLFTCILFTWLNCVQECEEEVPIEVEATPMTPRSAEQVQVKIILTEDNIVQ